MLIDWFTVAAQAVNFLILVWLLKRFLYRPVLAAIDAREKKIAAQLQSAAQREAQAQANRDDFQRRSEALDREREGILRSASADAAIQRQALLEAARNDSQALRAKLVDLVGKERQDLGRRLRTQTQVEVLALTRKLLADLSGVSLEERMVEVFIENLRRLPKESAPWLKPEWQPSADAATSGRATPLRTAIVHSAFELSVAQRTAIKTAVTDALGADLPIRFEDSPELVCGIDLRVGGTKLAWSVADYLDSVSQHVLAAIEPSRATSTPLAEVAHG